MLLIWLKLENLHSLGAKALLFFDPFHISFFHFMFSFHRILLGYQILVLISDLKEKTSLQICGVHDFEDADRMTKA